MTFDDQVHDHGPLAEPRALPQIATRQMLDAFKPPAETALFDAVASALEAPREIERRPVVILFSAGRDTRSRLASAQVIERARRADFPVFVVLARLNFEPRDAPPEGTTRLPVPVVSRAVPLRFYNDLAAFTGGTVQTVEPLTVLRHDTATRSLRAKIGDDGLANAFLRALDEFRSSYVLRYTPVDVRVSGWREIAVRAVRPGGRYTVRARKGYFVERLTPG